MSAAKKSVVRVQETRNRMMSFRGFAGFREYAHAHPMYDQQIGEPGRNRDEKIWARQMSGMDPMR